MHNVKGTLYTGGSVDGVHTVTGYKPFKRLDVHCACYILTILIFLTRRAPYKILKKNNNTGLTIAITPPYMYQSN